MSDYRAVPALLDTPVTKPKALLADKGYDSDGVRESLLWRGILPIISPKVNRREQVVCNFRGSRDRNHVERLFSRLKQSRRIATRYDKTASSFLGFLSLAAAKLWLRDYFNRAYISSMKDRVNLKLRRYMTICRLSGRPVRFPTPAIH